ncbi:hypothetical protein KDU71_16200 [Carboxylicivirga sediminis]|uniref:Outer membrane protein beta-barrel domain-containing protein n=1 Tax=Carboxylicivirga sediminis TaxID=2006564 RepID=A0A941F637_9BACT|nr:hypothetical protein [Carboxylicivirga sediminis]MBR8537114.1 hypothetical protein [Carboxylicivirga sediminis]
MRLSAILLLFVLFISHTVAQDYFLGGKIGYSFPTNIGRSSDELGFKDVAENGWQAAIMGKWFYNERLSLGCDLGYQLQDGSDFWNVQQYGEVSASYQTIRLLANGTYYFSHDEVRPYIGLSFGAYYMMNTIDFASNGLTNQSVKYTAKVWKPGVAPQLGLLVELSKKTMLDIHVQMDIITNMQAIYYPDAEPDYTENPHEKQNQISINIGLLFGL